MRMKVQMKLFLCRLTVIGFNGYYVSKLGWKNYDIQGYSSACAHAGRWPTEGHPTSMLTISTERTILNKNSQRPPSEDKEEAC